MEVTLNHSLVKEKCYKPITFPHPLLRQRSIETPLDIKLVENLRNTLDEYNCAGISAVQIGFLYRVMIIKTNVATRKEVQVISNPKIIRVSEDTEIMAEGCLSVPGFTKKIERPTSVIIEHDLISGNTCIGRIREVLKGMEARIFFHEYDHFEGYLINDL